jgi:6-phosphogluconolactonase (cycloisomerase 2 family)
VAGHIDGAIAVFARNTSSGALSFIEMTRVGPGAGLAEFGENMAMAISPEGQYLYVASPKYPDDSIVVYRRDATTGTLTEVQVMKEEPDPGKITLSVNQVNELVMSPDSRYIYATGWDEGKMAMFTRNSASGALTFVKTFTAEVTYPDGSTYDLDGLKPLQISPDGRHLYASGNFGRVLTILERDTVSGELTFSEVITTSAPASGQENSSYSLNIRTMALSSDGQSFYTTSTNRDSVDGITVFKRDGQKGNLTFVEQWQDAEPDAAPRYGSWAIAVSPDDRQVYLTTWGNWVHVYARGADGDLSFVEAVKKEPVSEGLPGFFGFGALTFSPDGHYVYTVQPDDNTVEVFKREQQSGRLTFVQASQYGAATKGQITPGLPIANDVAVSPEGRHLYVASLNENGVAVFSRNQSSGVLTFTEIITDGGTNPGGIVDGLAGAASVALSPDGHHVYAVSYKDNAITAFSRDPNSGRLTFLQALQDGVSSSGKIVDGLAGARALAASPDGRHLYVASFNDSAVAVFSRESTTGRLTFIEAIKDNWTGGMVNSLNGALGLVVSPEGGWVYVTSYYDSALVVFQRDQSSGTLTLEETYTRGNEPGLEGWVLQAATDTQGKFIYVTGETDNSLTVLKTPALTHTATLSPSSGLTSTLNNPSGPPQAPCDTLTIVGEEDIYLANPDGTELTHLLYSPARFTGDAKWSPDGTKLAYEEYGGDRSGSFWLATADGLDRKMLTTYDYVYGIIWDWLPDSRYIISYEAGGMHPDYDTISLIPIESDEGYSTTYGPYEETRFPYFKISDYSESDWVSNFRGTDIPLNVGNKEWAFTSPTWYTFFSPNKEWLVFSVFDQEQKKDVDFLAQSDGSIRKPFPEYKSVPADTICTGDDSPYADVGVLTWTPDSRSLIFASYQDNQTQLWALDVEDETEKLIAEFPAPGCPSQWQWSPDGHHASFLIATKEQDGYDVGDVYLLDWPVGQPYLSESNVVGAKLQWSPQSDYVLLFITPHLQVWDVKKRQLAVQVDLEPWHKCEWSPTGTWLACTGIGYEASEPGLILNAHTGEHTLGVDNVNSLKWSPDSRWVALWSPSDLQVYDTVTEQFKTIPPDSINDSIHTVLWTPRSCEGGNGP